VQGQRVGQASVARQQESVGIANGLRI
jgi:hypothetical protein